MTKKNIMIGDRQTDRHEYTYTHTDTNTNHEIE